MPEVSHTKVYETKLKMDSYQITKACEAGCKISDLNPSWSYCPYCGEEIVFVEVINKTEIEE